MRTFTVHDARSAILEMFTGHPTFRGPRDVSNYRELFTMYGEYTLFSADARRRLRSWADG